MNQNSNSHLTAIERTSLFHIQHEYYLTKKKIKGKILDFACGIEKM
jgi:hypothetical protein